MNECGAIFDMDGVIVDSGPAHLASWQRLAAELGKQITREEFVRSFGIPAREIIQMRFGSHLTAEEIHRLDDRKEQIYREAVRGQVPVMPGAVELIQSLHAEGWRLAIGSSGPPENVRLIVDELRLDRYLSATTDASQVTCGKPDPEVFLIAAARMGVSPDRCVVVEDSFHGIEAAHRAGMKAVGLTSTHPADKLHAADLIVGSLNGLSPSVLAGLVVMP